MGRTIKLLLYYFAYQLAFMGVFLCGYMLFHHTSELPVTTSGVGLDLVLWAQVLATAGIGLHLLIGKYVVLNTGTPACIRSEKIWLISVIFIIGMSLWTNYLIEMLALPNHLQEIFGKMMQHPLGILSITVMAPIVEEWLFRGAIQGHLLRKWKNPVWAITTASLIFGLVHGNPAQIPFAFILGSALGWMYYRTGSLMPGILMHFINNTTAVCLFLCCGEQEATMNDLFGTGGAAGLALCGVILTLLCIKLVRKLVPQPATWQTEEGSE